MKKLKRNLDQPLFTDEMLDAIKSRAAREALLQGNVEPAVEYHWPGVTLEAFQIDIISSIFNDDLNEILIKGCTGAGKGCAVAIAVNLWWQCFDRCTILVTSTSQEHCRTVLYKEVKKWRTRMRQAAPANVMAVEMKDGDRKQLKILQPHESEGATGHHGERILMVIDEATHATDEFYRLAKTQADRIVALGNPRCFSGWYRAKFPAHDPNTTQTIDRRRCITISGLDCRNVREGRLMIPNQLTKERFDEIMKESDPDYRRIYGLGEFVVEDAERQLILPSWLPRHVAAAPDTIRPWMFGLDVAASAHGDLTVLAVGDEDGVLALHTFRDNDTMKVVGWVMSLVEERYGIDLRQKGAITVDADGVGKGVFDRLNEKGVGARPFCGGTSSNYPERYVNLRTEAYGELADRLNPRGNFQERPFRLPNDPYLLEELVVIEKRFDSRNRLCLTPKSGKTTPEMGDPLRKRLQRSPDRADAVAYLYHEMRCRAATGWTTVNRPMIIHPLVTWDYTKERRSVLDEILNPRPLTAGEELHRLVQEKMRRLGWFDDDPTRM